MDNASKALIMAGAILISIAIIGVAVFLFSSSSGYAEGAGQTLDATAAQMTNSTLRQYANKRVRGTTVIEFLEYVKTANKSKVFPVDVEVNEGDVDAIEDVVSTAYYTITLTDENDDSYYDQYTIEKEEKVEEED